MEQSVIMIPMHNPENGAYCATARVRLSDGRARVDARLGGLADNEMPYLFTDRDIYPVSGGSAMIKDETVCGLAFMNGLGRCCCGGAVRGREALYENMLVRLRMNHMAQRARNEARTALRSATGEETPPAAKASAAPAAPVQEAPAKPAAVAEADAKPVLAVASSNDAAPRNDGNQVRADMPAAAITATTAADDMLLDDAAVQVHAPPALAVMKPKRPMRESASMQADMRAAALPVAAQPDIRPVDAQPVFARPAAGQSVERSVERPVVRPVAAQADETRAVAEHPEISGSEPAHVQWNTDFLPMPQAEVGEGSGEPFEPEEMWCMHPDERVDSGKTKLHPCRRPMKKDEENCIAPYGSAPEKKAQKAGRQQVNMQPQRVENPFPRQFPGSTWVKVSRLNGQGYHYEGRMRHGNGVMTITAAPGEYSPVPPMHLQGFSRFIQTKEGGFWVRVRQPRQ